MIAVVSNRRLYSLLISLILGIAGAQAAELFVSTQGSDSNPGSSTLPLRTITRAYSLATAGTTIIVMPGVYTDYRSGWGIHLGKSGTAASPIVLKSQVRGAAIVDGQNLTDRNQGFYISGSYNVVDGFEIRNSPHGGIAMYGNNNQVLNNEIHHNGNLPSTSTNGRDGVYSDKGTSGNYYAGNSIHDNGRTGSNLDHGLYLCGQDETVINNLLFRNAACGLQVAGYDTVSNMKVYNNVVAYNGTTGIILWMSLNGIDIRNNILFFNGRYGLNSYAAHGGGVIVDRNLSFGNAAGNYNFTAGGSDYSYTLGTTISADPLFVNGSSAAFDPHLRDNSPAINNALNLYSVFTTDQEGTPRPSTGAWDVGAFVYAPANTAPIITAIANQTTTVGVAIAPLAFQVSDAETEASNLSVSAMSFNPTLVPSGSVVLDGSGTNRTVTVQPASGQTGTATINLTVSDGSLTSSIFFTLTVKELPVGPVSFASTSGSISGPFYITNGAIAQSAYTSLSSGGRAVYNFSVPVTGDYVVLAQVNAPGINYNSLFINIDEEPSDPVMIWDIPLTTGFATRTASWRGNGSVDANQYAPKVFYLNAGEHQLVLRGREGRCQVGTITIAPLSTAAISTTDIASTPGFTGGTDPATTVDPGNTTTTNSPLTTESVLPLPWQAVDIGTVDAPGASAESNGIFTVTGPGVIGNTADAFRFVYQALTGDGAIEAQINSVEDTGTNTCVGVMIRESLTSDANFELISFSSDNTFRWVSRTDTSSILTASNSGTGSVTNVWVRLSRTGDQIQSFVSNDGENWIQTASATNVMAADIYIGLAVAPGSSETNSTSAFSNVIVTP